MKDSSYRFSISLDYFMMFTFYHSTCLKAYVNCNLGNIFERTFLNTFFFISLNNKSLDFTIDQVLTLKFECAVAYHGNSLHLSKYLH